MSKIPIFEKKNVLVTGGAGFIGSHLCEALLKEAKVICMDNLLESTLGNIDHLLQYPDFIFIKHDINEPIDLARFPELARFKVQLQGIQEVYHLACPTAPKEFDRYKMETLKANSVGTINVLTLAQQWHAKVLFASSSVVYGPRDEEMKFVSEEYEGVFSHLTPRACYDEGKRFSEAAVNTYKDVYGMDIRIARIFRTYGPRERLGIGEMLPDFIVSALEGKPLVIYGGQEFKTSLCYVSDMVDGLVKLMRAAHDIGPVNLGSDQEVNLSDVARAIITMTNSKSKIVFEKPLLFMRPQAIPDIAKAKNELAWFPVVRFEDGLAKMVEYTRGRKNLLGVN